MPMMHETVHPIWTIPFILLLGSIAIIPLVNFHWWEKRYPYVAIPLAVIVAAYYVFGLRDHHFLLHTLHEYFSFIALISALFVVAGGIHINVKGESKPFENTVFLLIGSVIANIIGTTGASMVMIRPWIRMNKYRITTFHIVFFIFLVSNIGGCLTPIGDPPLFLGFLKGIPFFWIGQKLFFTWLFVILCLLSIFYAFDLRNFKKAPEQIRKIETDSREEWKLSGKRNLLFLGAIVLAVFITEPLFIREALMIASAIIAYKVTPKAVHQRNNFGFGPILEVGILFFGLFMTMMPALQWLEANAQSLGISTPLRFFWGVGILSAFLDNAPTYLNFLSVALGYFCDPHHIAQIQTLISEQTSQALGSNLHLPDAIRNTLLILERYFQAGQAGKQVALEQIKVAYLIANHEAIIKAISLGAVFFGAATYIGNAPNFLVKSIAERERIKMKSFFGYVFAYTLPILIPLFALTGFLFLR